MSRRAQRFFEEARIFARVFSDGLLFPIDTLFFDCLLCFLPLNDGCQSGSCLRTFHASRSFCFDSSVYLIPNVDPATGHRLKPPGSNDCAASIQACSRMSNCVTSFTISSTANLNAFAPYRFQARCK